MAMCANEIHKGKTKINYNITKALPVKFMAPDWFTLTLLINFGVVCSSVRFGQINCRSHCHCCLLLANHGIIQIQNHHSSQSTNMFMSLKVQEYILITKCFNSALMWHLLL